MMRNRVIRVGIPSLKMSTMHGKGLTLKLLAQGYSVEEVESHYERQYESKYAQDCKAERAVSKELSLGKSIWKELTVSASAEEKQYDKETIRDRKEQPVR